MARVCVCCCCCCNFNTAPFLIEYFSREIQSESLYNQQIQNYIYSFVCYRLYANSIKYFHFSLVVSFFSTFIRIKSHMHSREHFVKFIFVFASHAWGEASAVIFANTHIYNLSIHHQYSFEGKINYFHILVDLSILLSLNRFK